MSCKVRDIYEFLDKIAPFDTAMDFDNCGLLVGNKDENIEKVLFSLDITSEVIEEAKKIGANLIVSHHPVIFSPLKRLNFDSVPSKLVANRINAICAHTNLDMADKYGVNACLAEKLGLKNLEPLYVNEEKFFNKIIVFAPKGYEDIVLKAMCESGAGTLGEYSECGYISAGLGKFKAGKHANPFIGVPEKEETVNEMKIEVICPKELTSKVIKRMLEVHPYEVPAYDIFENKAISQKISCGFVGELEIEMDCDIFAKLVKERLSCEGVRYTSDIGKNFTNVKKIKKVGVCSGAGGDYLSLAVKKGADAFVTGEIKHHVILSANEFEVFVVDAGHFKTEDIVFGTLKKIFESKFSTLKFYKSEVFTDKIRYL